MNSLKINCINNNLTFKGIRNTNKLAKISKNITKNPMLPVIGLGSCVGIGIRYNEKEPTYTEYRDDLINRIMELNTKIEAREYENGEKIELPESPLSKKMEERRLPDFSEREFDEDFYNNFDGIDHTPIEMADIKKETAIIKNRQLKTIAETICRKEQLNKSMLDYIRDIDAGLSNITNLKILKHLKTELKRIANIDYDKENFDDPETGECEYFFSLNRIAEIVDVYNTMTNRYSRYKIGDISSDTIYLEKSRPAEYMKNFRKYSPKGFKNFIVALNTESDKKHPLVADFESTLRTESLETLSNNEEMLDYMYEKYYLSKIADIPAKKLCREISHTYGTRVLLSNKTHDIRKALRIIKQELENWTIVSGGKAELPRILDLNSCDISYGDSSAYTDIRGNIHYNGAKIKTYNIIRHEIMHLNEPSMFAKYSADVELAKLIRSIIPSKKIKIDGRSKEILDWDNCKYREEFLKAGITPEHTEYAYTNRNEFLAVAAEGDFSQYSPEFKEILIKIGMPEYVFNLPVDDDLVETNVDRMKDILEEYPDANFDELVEYIEEAKAQELSPRERLLNAIFGINRK